MTDLDATTAVPRPFDTVRVLLWLQVAASVLVLGVAALLAIAAVPYGGLHFYPFDPTGPGLVDPKDVLPDVWIADAVAIPVITYGVVGSLVSAVLAAWGALLLALPPARRELSRRRLVLLALGTVLLAAHAVVVLGTGFGHDLGTWLAD
ncbi:hypothetical protein F4553_007889 [Allocatelliglobosispora scoriae]|uniref:Uncharacterized protein n=1 Tax=Allocatelliglobosispora scoriae TaxID=643052 RepID=A0A841C3J1_9ACTN|nr:hypothetical protein [Allocatelliglobosispora scoriae]MBB5874455.1 hypothetical protein [Allocatelliglobosispora scoriae]